MKTDPQTPDPAAPASDSAVSDSVVRASASPASGDAAHPCPAYDKEALARVVRERPKGTPVALAKKTSNLFRPRAQGSVVRLDVARYTGVLALNEQEGWADVLGFTTYDDFTKVTLQKGWMPSVVPELKTITVGGAISGGGIESSSYREGFVHEGVLEMDILTGTGEVITASPDNAHAELFFGFPCSYGSLGYVLRARVKLLKVEPYMALTHQHFDNAGEAFKALKAACGRGRPEVSNPASQAKLQLIDMTAFSPSEFYLTVATAQPASSTPVSNYTGRHIYYKSLREKQVDTLKIYDYLWRWDTDWFWCSRAFGAQHPLLRPLYRLFGGLNSAAYWKIRAVNERHRIAERLGLLKPTEWVIQDVEIPYENAEAFLAFYARQVGIWPLWICPAQSPQGARPFSLYRTDPDKLYLNFGFWGGVAKSEQKGAVNRRIEAEVSALNGKKSLYSSAYYTREQFEQLYGGAAYAALKQRYDPDRAFKGFYEKCCAAG